jgi:TRAP-type C4-dicarboxylate transport system substrate-binding protein
MHQMVPDLVLCNWAFLEGLSAEERAIFDEGFKIINTVQRDAWEGAVEEAKNKALNEQGVEFIYPDTAPFQEAVMPLHNEVLAASPALQPIYDMIQAYNAQYAAAE